MGKILKGTVRKRVRFCDVWKMRKILDLMPKSRKIFLNLKIFSRLRRDPSWEYQFGLRAKPKWHHFTSSHMNAAINIVIGWQQCLLMKEFWSPSQIWIMLSYRFWTRRHGNATLSKNFSLNTRLNFISSFYEH